MQDESAPQTVCETYLPLQESEQLIVVVLQAQRPEASHDVASCVVAHPWMHWPLAELHMQFASALQAPRALYSRPHLSVHWLPFHWHVVSTTQAALFVARPHEVLQA